jgi:hypothetical protein
MNALQQTIEQHGPNVFEQPALGFIIASIQQIDPSVTQREALWAIRDTFLQVFPDYNHMYAWCRKHTYDPAAFRGIA